MMGMNKILKNLRHKSPVESEKGPESTKTEPAEYGGPKGLEPTRYGDWEKRGKCVDF
jgi:hypothetical protein